MAVRDEATATGAERQGDLKQRNVGQTQANGNYIPKEVEPKLDEKTKQKVCQPDRRGTPGDIGSGAL